MISDEDFYSLWRRVNVFLAGLGRERARRAEIINAYNNQGANVAKMVASIIAMRDNPPMFII
jgi:hypothetical protein